MRFGEVGGELVVAAAQAVVVIAFDGVFGLLLCAERGCADLAMIGGVEAFDVADDGAAVFGGDGFAVEILGEGDVRAGEVFQFFEWVEEGTEFVGASVEAGVFVEADLCAAALVGLKPGLFDEGPQLRGAAVDELRAELDGLSRRCAASGCGRRCGPALRGRAPSDAGLGQGAGCGEAGHACADDEDFGVRLGHAVRCVGVSLTVRGFCSTRRRHRVLAAGRFRTTHSRCGARGRAR